MGSRGSVPGLRGWIPSREAQPCDGHITPPGVSVLSPRAERFIFGTSVLSPNSWEVDRDGRSLPLIVGEVIGLASPSMGGRKQTRPTSVFMNSAVHNKRATCIRSEVKQGLCV